MSLKIYQTMSWGLLGWLALASSAWAQVTSDSSIGTTVTPSGSTTYTITGGQLQGTTTLLHSFGDFSLLNTTDTAHFELGNASYGGTANAVTTVIGRVTGGNPSTINGQVLITGGSTPDLYLINPNGFVFGAGATLNVPGSFAASTTESVLFANGERFGVDGTTPPPLLTISAPLGLQPGTPPSGSTIVNRGNLNGGRDLTLAADYLDLQGQLTAGRDLTLTASHTVQIRDTATTAFQAQAGRDLTIQGNQQIDILALNHPTTPFQSGGNLRLISDGAISGDAHFASGGSLQFQTLGGDPGDFVSLYDPIIYANGDVVFGNYTGVALKVEATGSIQGGNITITGPDISGAIPATDPDFAILTTQPAAILRAGVASVPGPNTPFNGGGTSFASGTAALPTGSIGVGSVTTANTVGGNGGAIILTATGNIVTGLLNTTALSFAGNSGQSGSVTLAANGNLTVNGSISTSSLALTGGSSSGGTGAIALSSANGNLTINGSILVTSLATNTVGSSGPITLTTSNGNLVVTGDIVSDNQAGLATSTPGASANISLSATNGNLSVNAVASNTINLGAFTGGRAGNAGSITLTTTNGDLLAHVVQSIALGTRSNAGDIALSATNGNLSVLMEAISATASFNGNGGSAGNIALSTTQGDLVAQGDIQSLAVVLLGTGASGNGGAVTLTSANGNLITQGDISSVAYSQNGNAGSAGVVTLSAPQASILGNGNNLNSIAGARVGTAGNSNDITLTARNQISNVNLLTTSSTAQAGTVLVQGTGDLTLVNSNILTSQQVSVNLPAIGGLITLPLGTTSQSGDVTITSTGNLTLLNSAIESDTRTNAPAGTVTLTTPGLLQLNNSTVVSGTRSAGPAGNITVSAPQLTLTGGSRLAATTALGSTGQGGNITVGASTVRLQGGTSIAVGSSGLGDGGNIAIQSERLILENQSALTAETASAQGGNITLTTRDLLLLRNNSLISTTAGTALGAGNGGNVTINTPNGLVVAIPSENSDIRANAFTGSGGNITINSKGILGLQFQPRNTPNSDITANSQFGGDGSVVINTPGVDLGTALVELPTDFSRANVQIAEGCSASRGNSFTATGRGGVPLNPSEGIVTGTTWHDTRDLAAFMDRAPVESSAVSANQPASAIAEISSWRINAEGQVELVTSQPSLTAVNPYVTCSG